MEYILVNPLTSSFPVLFSHKWLQCWNISSYFTLFDSIIWYIFYIGLLWLFILQYITFKFSKYWNPRLSFYFPEIQPDKFDIFGDFGILINN